MSVRIFVSSAATFALVALLTPSDAQASDQCRPDGHLHFATSAPASSKKDAMKDALGSWKSFTAFEYGERWARYKNARLKSTTCREGRNGWVCSIEGNPCKARLRRTAKKR